MERSSFSEAASMKVMTALAWSALLQAATMVPAGCRCAQAIVRGCVMCQLLMAAGAALQMQWHAQQSVDSWGHKGNGCHGLTPLQDCKAASSQPASIKLLTASRQLHLGVCLVGCQDTERPTLADAAMHGHQVGWGAPVCLPGTR